VYGAEPLGADDAARSLKAGVLILSEGPKTIADGLLTSLGDLTFSILKEELEGILTVSEESIVYAMRLIWERMKLVAEPSGAVPLAAVLERAGVVPGEGADGFSKTGAGAGEGAGEGAPGENPFAGKRVGVIISGGNVDLEKLPF
jgi:threonine dehydratase